MRLLNTLVLLSFLASFSYGQHRHCGTDEYEQEQMSKDPNYTPYYLPGAVQTAIDKRNSSHAKAEDIIYIPVVFHVIHEYGPENISKAQIEDQMRVLNEDFMRLNPDTVDTRDIFKGVAANCNIQFKLATTDPYGNCTDGITRTVSPLTNGGDEDAKKLIDWDRKKYLNVWVVKSIGRAANILGYARLPTSRDKVGDGIIILSDYVGTIGTGNSNYMGRTLTHEIGHWLGLWHPFQNAGEADDCGTTNCRNSGDWICDTPPVLNASFGCDRNRNSCQVFNPDLPDQIENFMDYADGRCANMFTEDQKDRMRSYLANTDTMFGRGGTAFAENASIFTSRTCAPVADFHVVGRNTSICQGSSLAFENLSWNGDIVDRVWTFEGGSPSSSTFNNPTVRYNTPGTYKVSLRVSNGSGTNTIEKTEFITVYPAVSEVTSPYYEDFDNEWAPFTWKYDVDGNYGWRHEKTSGFENSDAIVCRIDDDTPDGVQYSVTSQNIDLDLHKDANPILSFRTAYSMRATGGAGERLVVYGSDDCGQTWSVLKAFIGVTSLSSTGSQIPDWEPSSASDWRLQTVNLAQNGFENSRNLLIRFEVTSAAGNSVFIDDVNVDRNVLSTRNPSMLNNVLRVTPNPSDGEITVSVDGLNQDINIEITNALGQKIQSLKLEANGGVIQERITLPASGMYLVRMFNQNIDHTNRFIVTAD